MTVTAAHLGWPSIALAVVLLADAAMIAWPPAFIVNCLRGVGFPRDWWWTLVVMKVLASAGLIIGLWVPGVGLAAVTGVLAYFCCAIAAHLRARSLGSAFWINCLGFTALALAVLILDFLLW